MATTNKVPLHERAVHPFFLLQIQNQQVEVPGKGKVALAELESSDLVKRFIKDLSPSADYIQSVSRKLCRHAWSRENRFRDNMPASATSLGIERMSKGEALWGPTTYFVSHCWAYKFKDLVNLVVRHYDAQPGTQGGKAYVPIFYWIDLFAVHQSFSGDFKDHPDSDFPGVIRASQAVLFTIMPWRSPLCVERVWCLFEALQAVSMHVDLELLVEDIQSNQSIDKLQQVFTKVVVENLDINKCKATVASDKKYILGQVEASLGVQRFNLIMQEALHRKVLEVMLVTAVQKNDLESAQKLVKQGVRVTQRVLAFNGYTSFDTDDKGLKALAEVLKISGSVSALSLHTGPGSKATHEGFASLMAALKGNKTLTDLTLAKGPREDLKKHEGGWVGPKAAQAIGDMLASNSALRRLDLSRNIKLTGTGFSGLAKGISAAGNSGLQELNLAECAAEGKGVAALADALIAGAAPASSSASTSSLSSGFSPSFNRPMQMFAGSSVMAASVLPKSSLASPVGTLGGSPHKLAPSASFRRASGMMNTPRVPIARLDLSLNQVGNTDGPSALGRMLLKTSTLTRLDLRGCDIGSAGIQAMAEGLGAATGLTYLDLSHNKFADDGAASLAGALKKSHSIRTLLLASCDIKDKGSKELGQALMSQGCPVQALALAQNPIGNAGAAAIGAGVRGNNTLQRLDLQGCGINGKEGVAGVAAALWSNKSLRELDLRNNPVKGEDGDGAARSLADSLATNHALVKLYLHNVLPERAFAALGKVTEGKQLEIDHKTPA